MCRTPPPSHRFRRPPRYPPYDSAVSIPGELERARQLILAAKEEAAKDILLSVPPEVEREDRDDLALEVFALLGELYLNRTAYDGTEECVRRIDYCLAAYADAAPRSGADHMTSRYRLRARFLRVGLAAAQGEHEAAATELAALQDDDCTRRFDDLAAEQAHLAALAGVLCATALCDDDLHARAALWRDHHSGPRRPDRHLGFHRPVVGRRRVAYGRFCVETGRLAEGRGGYIARLPGRKAGTGNCIVREPNSRPRRRAGSGRPPDDRTTGRWRVPGDRRGQPRP